MFLFSIMKLLSNLNCFVFRLWPRCLHVSYYIFLSSPLKSAWIPLFSVFSHYSINILFIFSKRKNHQNRYSSTKRPILVPVILSFSLTDFFTLYFLLDFLPLCILYYLILQRNPRFFLCIPQVLLKFYHR